MDQINCLALATLLLLGVIVFAVGKKAEISTRRQFALSCGPGQSANGSNPWPGNDNSGNSCPHQPVTAALLDRSKRGKISKNIHNY